MQAHIQQCLFVYEFIQEKECYKFDEASPSRERQLSMQKDGQQSQLQKGE